MKAFISSAIAAITLVSFTSATSASNQGYSELQRRTDAPPLPPCPQNNYAPFTYVGCFAETDPLTVLPYNPRLEWSTMTVETCTATCKSNGFKYAGLVYFGHCQCGTFLPPISVPESECNAPCKGNTTQFCGANKRFSVYQDSAFSAVDLSTIASQYTAKGCYSEGTGYRAVHWRQKQLDFNTLTTEQCLKACGNQRYPLAATEYYGECYCGVALQGGSVPADSSNCKLPCKGNSAEICGGAGFLNLYEAPVLRTTQPCGTSIPVTCPVGNTTCGASCFNLQADPSNCGACGNACALGTTCQSGRCASAPLPGNCSNYTASCSSVINGILATNSIASPQLVDYRIQNAILGLTSPSSFLAALGPNPCQRYTDPIEHDTCVGLLANSEFVRQLTDITVGVLTSFQTCASDFAAGRPDYQVIINEPDNATCRGPNSVRRHVKRVGEDHDLTQSMLEGIEHYRMTAAPPVLGQMKSPSDLIQLVRKQQSTCSRTGTCFERCPECRSYQTFCGPTMAAVTSNLCGGVGVVAGVAAGVLATAPCGGPANVFCIGMAGGFVGLAANGLCTAAAASFLCNPLSERCANCNSVNGGICNADSTQCCAGETGTRCGANCCCCPRCQAPGGINCACTAASC